MAADILDEIAALITEVGRCYQRGRRYRDLATLCDDHYLPRALEIGSTIRLLARSGDFDPREAVAAADTLRDLLAGCESAVAGVHRSDRYRRTVAAWEARRFAEVAIAAPAIFAAVELHPACTTLYHPLAITSRRGGGDHFIPPSVCADAIVELSRFGIVPPTAPPELGADDIIRALLLSEDPEATESPIALAIEPSALDVPVCHLVPAGDAVVYTARLQTTFRVRFAERVSDEWWAVRPDAYGDYVDRLKAELAARGLAT